MSAVSYYPGCSLHATARDYQESIDGIADLIGLELKEIEDWNCCGASAAHSINHDLAIGLAARNLANAEKAGLDVLAPCALCFHQLKQGEKALLAGWDGAPQHPFKGDIQVYDLLSFLSQEEWMIPFEARVVKSLTGLKVVCYYGCQVARPADVTGHPNPENPMEMERVVKACGAEALDWSHKTDCCGASLAMPRQDIVFKLVGDLYDRALETGAEAIVVSCQMCQANLDMYQEQIAAERGIKYRLPIIYFTELMGVAAGIKEADIWMGRHFIDPREIFKELS